MIKSNRDRSIEDLQEESFQNYINNIQMTRGKYCKTPDSAALPFSPKSVCDSQTTMDDQRSHTSNPQIYNIQHHLDTIKERLSKG